jgi:hypothetical protein
MKKTLLIVGTSIAIAISSIIVTSCSSNKNVVGKGFLTKRKYLKGYFLDLASNNKDLSSGTIKTQKDKHKLFKSEESMVIEPMSGSGALLSSSNANVLDLINIEQSKLNQENIGSSKTDIKIAPKSANKFNNEVVKGSKKRILTLPISAGGGGGKGMSIAGMVLGILSILTCWLPYVGLALGTVGLVLSALAFKKEDAKGMAIAGLVTSIVGIALGLWPILFAATIISLF